jgi:hypothetical protein
VVPWPGLEARDHALRGDLEHLEAELLAPAVFADPGRVRFAALVFFHGTALYTIRPRG